MLVIVVVGLAAVDVFVDVVEDDNHDADNQPAIILAQHVCRGLQQELLQ